MLERGAFEEEPDGEISSQGNREIPRRHAVWPYFDLTNDTGPPPQRQQLGGQIVLPLIIRHAKLSEGILNGAERIAPGVIILGDDTREDLRPGTAVRCQ